MALFLVLLYYWVGTGLINEILMVLPLVTYWLFSFDKFLNLNPKFWSISFYNWFHCSGSFSKVDNKLLVIALLSYVNKCYILAIAYFFTSY